MANSYTFAQLEQLWINAGGDRASAAVMAAIALAESSGNPAATNHNKDGSTDRGLWQINSTNVDSTSMFNPADNAREAVKIKASQGLGAWVTYTTGAYRQFMSNAAPDPNLPSGSTSTATPVSDGGLTGDLGSAIGQGLGNAFQAVMQPFIATAIWGTQILFGIGLMVAGTIVFIMNTDTGKRVTSEGASLAGTAATAALPELSPEMAASARLRTASGRREAIRTQARERARNSPTGQRVAAEQRERRVQAEQRKQVERKAIRQEAARRNGTLRNGKRQRKPSDSKS